MSRRVSEGAEPAVLFNAQADDVFDVALVACARGQGVSKSDFMREAIEALIAERVPSAPGNGRKTLTLNVRVDRGKRDRLREIAEQFGLSDSELFRDALLRHMARTLAAEKRSGEVRAAA